MISCGRCGKEIMSTPDCGLCESYRRVPRAMRATQAAIDEGRYLRRPVRPFGVNEEGDETSRGIGVADVIPASEDPGWPDYLDYA